ncbi:unnamed protein product [Gordionus sp. m RMFG-2023]|uniref:uncharacterized protein LOC135929698 n=1 Tax=Gordionus sp. m RMFG-2023 TaxID=3053472 RepID=UPI0030E0F7C2
MDGEQKNSIQHYGVRSYLDNFYSFQSQKRKISDEGMNIEDGDTTHTTTEKNLLLNNKEKISTYMQRTKNCCNPCLSIKKGCCYLIWNPKGFKLYLILSVSILILGLTLIICGFFIEKAQPTIYTPEDIETQGNADTIFDLETHLEAYIDSKIYESNNENKDNLKNIYAKDKMRKNLLIIDKKAIRHNRIMRWVKTSGLILFFGAGLLFLLSMLAPLFCSDNSASSSKYDNKDRIKRQRKGKPDSSHLHVDNEEKTNIIQSKLSKSKQNLMGEMIEVDNLSSSSSMISDPLPNIYNKDDNESSISTSESFLLPDQYQIEDNFNIKESTPNIMNNANIRNDEDEYESYLSSHDSSGKNMDELSYKVPSHAPVYMPKR